MKKQPSEFSAHLGSLIKVTRAKTGLKQKQVAEEVKASATDISRIESGLQVPGLERFAHLCRVLELDPGRTLWELATDKRTGPPLK